jgi:hypothetical protein
MTSTTRPRRALAAILTTLALLGAAGGIARADTVSNNLDATIDATAELLNVPAGGSGSVGLYIDPTNGDGKNGCNLTAASRLVVSVASDNAAASVSPSQVTFDSCGATRTVTVAGVSTGTATISLSQVSNNTGATFDLVPATFVVSVAVAKTATSTSVTCPATVTYNGAAQTPCTAIVTGANGFSQPAAVTYSNNTDAGSATASASYAGDATRLPSSGTATFTILKAPTTTQLSCLESVVYNGEAQEPCTATANGNVLAVTYEDNRDVGPASASASYVGDANHEASDAFGMFEIRAAESTVTIACGAGGTYDGTAKLPCTAVATGAGGLSVPVAVTYDDNVNAGPVTASATFAGDANHAGSSDNETFSIAQASSSIDIDCSEAVYTGLALTPCTATATGAGGLVVDVPVTYSNNIDAGTASASANFDGDDNHTGSTNSVNLVILKAPSEMTLTCAPATYTGSIVESCSAFVTGAGGLHEQVAVVYGDNVEAGTATAAATYNGDINHGGSSASATFAIAKASSTVTVTCDPETVTYTGAPQEHCDATVTGAGGLDQALLVSYSGNIDAGTATASASYAGDANHEGSSDAATFTIDRAASVVSVTCSPSSLVFTGSPITPCSATVTGAGDLDETLEVSYSDNTNAGPVTASASYAGDANHVDDAGTATFTIEKAASTVTVSCPSNVTFTGSAQEPCSAIATGAGGLNETLEVSYSDNTNAGTATASASYAGDANHVDDAGTATFTIEKAPSTVTVTCSPSSVVFTGSPITPCSALVMGAAGLDQSVPVAYTANTAVGTATASATYPGDANHLAGEGSATFAITAWTLKGFYQPVDMSTPSTTVWNTVKNGSTVPFKFELFSGSSELTSTTAVKSFTVLQVNCTSSGTIDDIELTTTGGTSLRYDATAGQFVQNWQTPRAIGSCYKVTMTAQDGSMLSAWFKLK